MVNRLANRSPYLSISSCYLLSIARKNVTLIILETIIINKTIENKRHNYSTVLFRKEGRKDRRKEKGKEGGRKYGSSSSYQF